jgi:hypothetical protein
MIALTTNLGYFQGSAHGRSEQEASGTANHGHNNIVKKYTMTSNQNSPPRDDAASLSMSSELGSIQGTRLTAAGDTDQIQLATAMVIATSSVNGAYITPQSD